MSNFEKFEEKLPSKEKSYRSLTGKKKMVTKTEKYFQTNEQCCLR